MGEIALNIDISKAFHLVDWNFYFGILRKMGFRETWVN